MTTGQYNMEGQVINRRWKCTQKLGEGSFGAVYKAVQVRTGQGKHNNSNAPVPTTTSPRQAEGVVEILFPLLSLSLSLSL